MNSSYRKKDNFESNFSNQESSSNASPSFAVESHPQGIHGQGTKSKVIKSHSRSASYGGRAPILRKHEYDKEKIVQGLPPISDDNGENEPYSRGHQRAFSHGEVNPIKTQRGPGFKTEFVLPDGHEEKEFKKKEGGSFKRSTWKKGHSRDPSRSDSVYTIRDQEKRSLLQRIFFWKKNLSESCTRLVVPNPVVPYEISGPEHPNFGYTGNEIRTTKYTVLSFIPKNLFEQFHRFANLYFLFIAFLNYVPSVNAFARELSLLPLIFVLSVTAIKDAFEDRRRHKSDLEVNGKTCRVFSRESGRFEKCLWSDVTVGDIVHLSCDEMIPADMVLLNTSDEHGICYIESSNLDGESHLKQRQSITGIATSQGDFDVTKFDCIVEVGPPSTKIYHFVGSMPLSPPGPPQSIKRISLNKDNVILRDCVLKNTDYVDGLVVYAGHESKALLNNGGPRYKRSKLERAMNHEVVWCVAILVLLSFLSALGSGLWMVAYKGLETFMSISVLIPTLISSDEGTVILKPAHKEVSPDYGAPWYAFTNFWTFLILYQVLIPISLYVTIEVVKVAQVYHIQADPDFEDENKKTIRCNALNMAEELGQVEHVFTDKTGTLTENHMIFQRCSINGVDYMHPAVKVVDSEDMENTFVLNANLRDEIRSLELQSIYIQSSARPFGHQVYPSVMQTTGDEISHCLPPPRPYASKSGHFLTKNSQRILDFFLTLSTCNTVVVAKRPHRDQIDASGEVVMSGDETDLPSPGHHPSHSFLRSLFKMHKAFLSPISSNYWNYNVEKEADCSDKSTWYQSPENVDNSVSNLGYSASNLSYSVDDGANSASYRNNSASYNKNSAENTNFDKNSAENTNFEGNSDVSALSEDSADFSASNFRRLSFITDAPEDSCEVESQVSGEVKNCDDNSMNNYLQRDEKCTNFAKNNEKSAKNIGKNTKFSKKAKQTHSEFCLKEMKKSLPKNCDEVMPKMSSIKPTVIKSGNMDRKSGENIVENGDFEGKKLTEKECCLYEAESPDEVTLVNAAARYGVKLIVRSLNEVLVAIPGFGVQKFPVLNILPFDSVRKRMSVIVRWPQTGEIVLYCKGADTAIIEKLSERRDEVAQLQLWQLEQQLKMYCKSGLRVLCMARRILTENEYEEWHSNHKKAENSLVHRDRKLTESFSEIEKNFELIGATGIEDKLQEGVPETLKSLRGAGIKIWILTGDKQETAINIAYSCCLFNPEMKILFVNGKSRDHTESIIRTYTQQINDEERQHSLLKRTKVDIEPSATQLKNNAQIMVDKRGLVIDGSTLVYVLDRRANLREVFFSLASKCGVVLACRANPLQKALLVKHAQDKMEVLTLAVGDGANDVSMIQTADIGVGISGVEGRQAVMSSDFAITRFRHLEKLLLIHGHWCYDRLARLILYFFYKNSYFVFLIMWFQVYCGYSTTSMLDDMYLVMFNLLFTSIPPLAVGIYDQAARSYLLQAQPKLYRDTQRSREYNTWLFWINILDAFYQSSVVFFLTKLTYSTSETGIYEFGLVITHLCVATQLLTIALETKLWTVIHIVGIAFSYVIFLIFGALYPLLCQGCMGLPNVRGEYINVMSSGRHWLCFFVVCVIALLPRLLYRVLRNSVFASRVSHALIFNKRKNRGNFLKSSEFSSASSVYRKYKKKDITGPEAHSLIRDTNMANTSEYSTRNSTIRTRSSTIRMSDSETGMTDSKTGMMDSETEMPNSQIEMIDSEIIMSDSKTGMTDSRTGIIDSKTGMTDSNAENNSNTGITIITEIVRDPKDVEKRKIKQKTTTSNCGENVAGDTAETARVEALGYHDTLSQSHDIRSKSHDILSQSQNATDFSENSLKCYKSGDKNSKTSVPSTYILPKVPQTLERLSTNS